MTTIHASALRNMPRPASGGRSEPARAGATVWLTGLPSAGKSTIAGRLAELLRAEGRGAEILDGDEVRAFLSAGLGFSRADRDANVRRIGYVAELLARNGVLVLAAVVSPFRDSRESVRQWHRRSATPFLEVHVATPVEVCADRDVKGLYARQRAGTLTGLTGVDAPYEPPSNPELRIAAESQDVAASVRAVRALLVERGLV